MSKLQGVGDRQGGLACCSPWGRKESDTPERPNDNNRKSLFSSTALMRPACRSNGTVHATSRTRYLADGETQGEKTVEDSLMFKLLRKRYSLETATM